ncbi:MAG: universal stress protein [Woeseiaceae bacterium]|nr:universal stress protein [Woeseiaceae bacterium]
MSLILVPVADRPECARALNSAFDLGRRLGATILGCHMRPHRVQAVKRGSARALALYEKIAAENAYVLSRRAKATPTALWSERVGSADTLMGIVGPVADLIVVSRPAKTDGAADAFMMSALVSTGRPVLILPQRSRKRIGKRVCIAWDQSVAASIAVTPGIPILQQADEVTIVTCGPEDKPGPKATLLARYLTSWGIESRRVRTRGHDIEKELLGEYRKAGSDLLIGGAYSRSRWRERVFGGTTEFLIRKARIPVLLRHV